MTIIQLLNKCAIGEKTPKKIKWNDIIFEYDVDDYEPIVEHYYGQGLLDYIAFCNLNDEIEIVEE